MNHRATDQPDPKTTARQAWLGILARASAADLHICLKQAPQLPAYALLREPEIGLIMAQGRIGGSGAAFNLGEITVTRCSIRDDGGRVGHGYATGRDLLQAELMARLDAVMQDADLHVVYHHTVIEPLQRAQHERRIQLANKAAATEVKFFTLETMRS